MAIGPAAQILAFALFSLIAVAGALGMATTMSMFRSGVFLMASFIGVAGLFVLLMADLLGLLQVMMYIGGMLVMILFMVLFSTDPGGAMMAGMMEMAPLERLFSLGLDAEGSAKAGMQHEGTGHTGHGGGGMEGMGTEGMDMEGMSMYTPIKRPAAVLASLVGVLLATLLLLRPAWPVTRDLPDPDSARRVGELLMERYMVAFEGAGLTILLGIFAAVLLSRPARHRDRPGRERLRAAVDEDPVPIEAEARAPLDPAGGGVEP